MIEENFDLIMGSIGTWAKWLFSFPSQYISTYLTPHIVLIGVSVLFGFMIGRASKNKWVMVTTLGLIFYLIMRLLGVS